MTALSCVDGSFYARVDLRDFDVCRLWSCVGPFDAIDISAGLDEVRTLGPKRLASLQAQTAPDESMTNLSRDRIVSHF